MCCFGSDFVSIPHAAQPTDLPPHRVWLSRYVQPVTYAVPTGMDDGGSNSGYETMESRRGGPPPLEFESNDAYAVPAEAEGGAVEFAGLQANTAYESAVVGDVVRRTHLPCGRALVLLPLPVLAGRRWRVWPPTPQATPA